MENVMISYKVTFDENGVQTSFCTPENTLPFEKYYDAPIGFNPETEECELRDGFVYRIPKIKRTFPTPLETVNARKREFGGYLIDKFGAENERMINAGKIDFSDIGAMIQFMGAVSVSLTTGATTTARDQLIGFHAQKGEPEFSWLKQDRLDKYVNEINDFLATLPTETI